MSAERVENATPCTQFADKFAELLIRPPPIIIPGRSEHLRPPSEYSSVFVRGSTGDVHGKIDNEISEMCNTVGDQISKRQRHKYEETERDYGLTSNCTVPELDNATVVTLLSPRATYPDNFKNNRSRSFSDFSACSQPCLYPLEGVPSLPCSPRASIGSVTIVSSTSTTANTTAEASPCPSNREKSMSFESLRFVSIASPSPCGTPRTPSSSGRFSSRKHFNNHDYSGPSSVAAVGAVVSACSSRRGSEESQLMAGQLQQQQMLLPRVTEEDSDAHVRSSSSSPDETTVPWTSFMSVDFEGQSALDDPATTSIAEAEVGEEEEELELVETFTCSLSAAADLLLPSINKVDDSLEAVVAEEESENELFFPLEL